MRQPWMYSDGVLTVREVMRETDGARLMWRAAWRFVRRERRREPLWSSFTAMETRVMEMLREHHSTAPRTAGLIARHISEIRQIRSSDRVAACSDHVWFWLRAQIRDERQQPPKFRTAKY